VARVLIIEDNPENLELMRFLLHAFHHDALIARDGEAGLALASREVPDLIISDVHMPRLDGFGVLQRLRGDPRLKQIPCIAVTALAMLGDRGKVLDAGFDGYISKPIEPEGFVAEVQGFLKNSGACPGPVRGEYAPSEPAVVAVEKFASVLVVDDSPTNRDLIEHTLTPFGYAVTVTDNVADALIMARTNPPDLIISDLHMPDQDGFAFLKAVKGETALAAIPFMFLSSSVWGHKDAEKVMEMGAQRFLQRPIEPQTLLRDVAAVLPSPRKE
jgi:two-component system cell cycle response regulator